MDPLVFRSRIDPLLAAFVVVPIGGVIGLVVQRVIVRGQSPSAVTVGALVLSIGLVAWIFATTSYRFTERELVVQSGPLRVRVPFDTIRRVTRTRSFLSAPALSHIRRTITSLDSHVARQKRVEFAFRERDVLMAAP
jgi:Bacterial PH domain